MFQRVICMYSCVQNNSTVFKNKSKAENPYICFYFLALGTLHMIF